MNSKKTLPALILAVLAAGCERAQSPTGALEPLARAFPAAAGKANDPVFESVQLALNAARSNDLDGAALSLKALRSESSITPEQLMAIHEAMGNFQSSLAIRADKGDPAAQHAMDLLRGGHR